MGFKYDKFEEVQGYMQFYWCLLAKSMHNTGEMYIHVYWKHMHWDIEQSPFVFCSIFFSFSNYYSYNWYNTFLDYTSSKTPSPQHKNHASLPVVFCCMPPETWFCDKKSYPTGTCGLIIETSITFFVLLKNTLGFAPLLINTTFL
jgi:hypothetical protein